MPRTVSDAIVSRLHDWGVERIFGYSGDGIDGFIGAIQRDGGIEFVQARHEEMAAFMAVGHNKFGGGIGVCVSTQGPGAIHLLNGVYDAKLDHKPLLAIVGQQAQSVLGSTYQQEIDLQTLFKDACAQYCQTVHDPKQIPMVIDRAIRIAISTRSPVCIILPHDVQVLPEAEHPQAHGVMKSSAGIESSVVVPSPQALDKAAEVLNNAERPAIIIGQGAAAAATQVMDVAEALGAGLTYALMGKGIIDDHLPFVTGPTGHLGTTASWELMQSCDALLMVGTNEPYTEFLPKPGAARAVQIDIDGRNVGYRYPTEVNLIGDAAATLESVASRLTERDRSDWRSRVESWVSEWRETRKTWAESIADPLNPQFVYAELGRRLPDDAILAVDVGSTTYWYARYLDMRPPMRSALSSTLASMGSAMPYGIAAKLLHPDRPVFALAGDGAMQMNGLAEMITLAARWKQWSDQRFMILVLHNGDLNEVSWEMREMEGNPRFSASQDIPAFPYASYAELLGLTGLRVDSADIVGKTLDRALSMQTPVLVEAIVDADIPLLAPHLDEQHSQLMLDGLEAEGPSGTHARELLLEQNTDELTLPSSD